MKQKYTWVKFADDKHGNGMSDNHFGKKFIGLAFDKISPNDSNNPDDYVWSPMF
jgi:hypothetical protein